MDSTTLVGHYRGVSGQISEVRRSGVELYLEWKIPRFLDLPCGNYDRYDSRRFDFCGARWFMSVWPNWDSSRRVFLFLYRDDNADPSARTLNVSSCVRGSVEWRSEGELEFKKSGGRSLVDSCTRSALREQKERVLPGGELTVECVMKVPGTAAREQGVKQVRMDPCNKGTTGEISEVRGKNVEWRIPRFLDLPCGGFYDSPRFLFYNARWHLRVWLNWLPSGPVSLSLCRDHYGGPSARTVTFSAGVRGSGGGVERMRGERREFRKGDCWYLDKLFTRSELWEQKEMLMPGDALTIVCEIKVPGTAAGGQRQPSDECDICCEAPVDCALNPCGHTCWCYNCALRFWEAGSPRCPMCRKSIQNILKLYRK